MPNLEVDLDSFTPEQLASIKKKLLKNETSKADKTICPASVKIASKPQVNKFIDEGRRDVYKVSKSDDDGKEQISYYTQCTRTLGNSASKYCYKHHQMFQDNPDKLNDFEDIIVDAIKMNKADKLEIKVKETRQTTDPNPDPILIVNVNNDMKKMFAKTLASINESSSDAKNASDDDKSASDDDNASNDDNASDDDKSASDDDNETNGPSDDDKDEVDSDASDSDDGTEAIAIETKDGRELHLDQDSDDIYDVDDDGNGTLMGKLTNVSDSKAPIEYNGSNCIVAVDVDIQNKKNNYVRCALSNKLYEKKGSKLVKVGRVSSTKNGGFKPIFDKK
jgi:hypothetical protein